MIVQPGGTAFAFFNVSINGADTSIAPIGADVRRNGIVTTVQVQILEVSTGGYQCSFTVPSDWVGYDQVHVAFTLNHLGENLTCVKHVGTVGAAALDDHLEYNLDRILDLLEADETYDKKSGQARKLLRGTSTVLLEKTIVGPSRVESVSIRE